MAANTDIGYGHGEHLIAGTLETWQKYNKYSGNDPIVVAYKSFDRTIFIATYLY